MPSVIDGHDPSDARLRVVSATQVHGGIDNIRQSLPALYIAQIAECTLRACLPLANKLTELGLYSGTPSEWKGPWPAQRLQSLFSGEHRGHDIKDPHPGDTGIDEPLQLAGDLLR
jgi:hypothetical protein